MMRWRLGWFLVASLMAGAGACGAPAPAAAPSDSAPARGAAPSAAVGASSGAPVAASGQPGSVPAAALAPLQPAVPVKVAFVQSIGNAGIYVALERGYFQEQGLDVE